MLPSFDNTRWLDEYRWHGDMLADENRNEAYALAIKEWVRQQVEKYHLQCEYADKNSLPLPPGPCPSVLEIGTGSGLLSSLVSKEVALQWPQLSAFPQPELNACEVVPTLHEVASRNFERNIAEDGRLLPIKLLPLSHSLNINKTWLSSPATLVLGELLDTGLLGEGLISSMRDAKQRLTASEVVPWDGSNKDKPSERQGFEALPAGGVVIAGLCQSSLALRMGGLRDDEELDQSLSFVEDGILSAYSRPCTSFSRSFQTYHPAATTSLSRDASMFHEANKRKKNDVNHNCLQPNSPSGYQFKVPTLFKQCPGSAAAEGMHIQLNSNNSPLCEDGSFTPLTSWKQCLSFDFTNLNTHASRSEELIVKDDGIIHAIVYWWRVDMLKRTSTSSSSTTTTSSSTNPAYMKNDLDMFKFDELNQIHVRNCNLGDSKFGSQHSVSSTSPPPPDLSRLFMSTAPGYTSPPDHWRQNVIPLTNPIKVKQGDVVELKVFHDEDMIWFEIESVNRREVNTPSCHEKVHHGNFHHNSTLETESPSPLKCRKIENTDGIVSSTASTHLVDQAESTYSTGTTTTTDATVAVPPICHCGLHATHSRCRLLALNDQQRRLSMMSALLDLQTKTMQLCESKSRFGDSADGVGDGISDGSNVNEGIVVVLGDGPLLPCYANSLGFDVIVITFSEVVKNQQSMNKTFEVFDPTDKMNALFEGNTIPSEKHDREPLSSHQTRYLHDMHKFITQQCLSQSSHASSKKRGIVLFSNFDMTSDTETATLYDVIKKGVEKIKFMRTNNDEGSIENKAVTDVMTPSAVAPTSTSIVGLISEPYFAACGSISDEGSWGWEAMLLLWSTIQSLSPPDEIFNKAASITPSADTVVPVPVAVDGVHMMKIVSYPRRAVVRGCFFSCQKLWSTLVPPPGDGRTVQGIDMLAAFQTKEDSVSERKQQNRHGGSDDQHPMSTDHLSSSEEEECNSSPPPTSFLRCKVSGDVTQDAVPFNLYQWRDRIVQVGETMDLLSIDLSSDQTMSPSSSSQFRCQPQNSTADLNKTRACTDALSKDIEPTLAHVFCLWIDYEMCPSSEVKDEELNDADNNERVSPPHEQQQCRQSSWLLNGPDCEHASQGVLALSKPFDFFSQKRLSSSGDGINCSGVSGDGMGLDSITESGVFVITELLEDGGLCIRFSDS